MWRLIWIAVVIGLLAQGGIVVAQQPPLGSGTADDGAADTGADGVLDITHIDLEELMEVGDGSGGAGSFGFRLAGLQVQTFLHAFVTFDAALYDPFDFDLTDAEPMTFDLRYFNVFVGAQVGERLMAEVQLEHEHGGEAATVRTALLDYKLHDAAILRVGLFLTPFGRYNETLYPEYITVLPRAPFVHTMSHVIPTAWTEVGVQLRGEFHQAGFDLGYMAYIVNGLEQADDETRPGIDDGGHIRKMRGNFRDTNHVDKGIGARVYGRIPERFEGGVSAYTGAYTVDGKQRLTMFDVDVELTVEKLLARVEGVYTRQGVAGGHIANWGVYARLAYRLHPKLRPAVGWDYMTIHREGTALRDGNGIHATHWQVALGLDFIPWPESLPTTVLRLAASRQYSDSDGDGKDDAQDNLLLVQLTTGF